MAFLSAAGLYSYDPTIFDDLQLPEGVDRDALVFDILAETAELEVIYPHPLFFREAVKAWSGKNQRAWNRLFATESVEYDPTKNFGRSEEWRSNNSAKVAAYNDGLVDLSSGAASNGGTVEGFNGSRAELLEKERRAAVWTLHDHIISDFKRRFCILVY